MWNVPTIHGHIVPSHRTAHLLIRVKSHTILCPGALKRESWRGIWSFWAIALEPTTPLQNHLTATFCFSHEYTHLLLSILVHDYSVAESLEPPIIVETLLHDPCLKKLMEFACTHLHEGNPLSFFAFVKINIFIL